MEFPELKVSPYLRLALQHAITEEHEIVLEILSQELLQETINICTIFLYRLYSIAQIFSYRMMPSLLSTISTRSPCDVALESPVDLHSRAFVFGCFSGVVVVY